MLIHSKAQVIPGIGQSKAPAEHFDLLVHHENVAVREALSIDIAEHLIKSVSIPEYLVVGDVAIAGSELGIGIRQQGNPDVHPVIYLAARVEQQALGQAVEIVEKLHVLAHEKRAEKDQKQVYGFFEGHRGFSSNFANTA